MLSSFFLNPWMLLGAGAVAVPIAIHIFHRYRYKQVRWAAMDFLLDSQRKNRRRILIEQLLLLACRCLLVLGIVAIIARPVGGEGFAALFAQNQRSEHWILLDDSMSMRQAQGSADCFASGLEAAERLIESLASGRGNPSVTVVRTSKYETPDLLAARIDEAFVPRFRALIGTWEASYSALPPTPAVLAVAELAGKSDVANRSVHLISDFRAKDWPADGDLVRALTALGDIDVRIHLIDTAPAESRNLSLAAIEGKLGAAAAAVPFELSGAIENQGLEASGPITAGLSVDGKSVPPVSVAAIPPGTTAAAAFTVELPAAGDHQAVLSIPEDELLADNHRYAVVSLPESIPILIIDGSPKRTDSLFLSLALAPGGGVRTGLDPLVRGPEFLATANLDEYRCVFLLNVPRLEKPAVEALLRFVRNGGGIANFLGPEIQMENYNSLASTATAPGILPAKIAAPVDTTPAPDVPDLTFVASHPIFRIFAGERNPFVETVRVSKLFPLAEEKLSEGIQAIASYRDGTPLVLETSLGKGRILTFLTTAGPTWNNWGRNPSYVVVMLELARYLAQSAVAPADTLVGDTWTVRFPMKDHRREVRVLPPESGDQTTAVELNAEPRDGQYQLAFSATSQPGIYTAVVAGSAGDESRILHAVNVDPREGALRKVTRAALEASLRGVRFQYYEATEILADLSGASVEPRDWLLFGFLVLLFGEQLLALRQSYHLR